MNEFLQRLRQRELRKGSVVVALAFAFLQGIDPAKQ